MTPHEKILAWMEEHSGWQSADAILKGIDQKGWYKYLADLVGEQKLAMDYETVNKHYRRIYRLAVAVPDDFAFSLIGRPPKVIVGARLIHEHPTEPTGRKESMAWTRAEGAPC